MNELWIVRGAAENAPDLARLRLVAGLEVAAGVDCFWLRAPAGDEARERLLSTVAGRRFRLAEGDRLVPWGKLVPTERLPELGWRPIAEWMHTNLPVAAFPGTETSRVPLSLVRCRAERPAAALLTDADCWLRYATEAPEVRLRRLVFAMSRQRVFILGTPLPPIVGQPYAIEGGVAVACGWSISPAVGSAVIRELLRLETGDVALFGFDGSFQRIAGEHFMQAGRSAVRASVQGVADV